MLASPRGPAACRQQSQSTLRPLRSAIVSQHLLDTPAPRAYKVELLLCRTPLCSREGSLRIALILQTREEAGGGPVCTPVSHEAVLCLHATPLA